jgi:hypothetical protein
MKLPFVWRSCSRLGASSEDNCCKCRTLGCPRQSRGISYVSLGTPALLHFDFGYCRPQNRREHAFD